jgi:hypothetical protein
MIVLSGEKREKKPRKKVARKHNNLESVGYEG